MKKCKICGKKLLYDNITGYCQECLIFVRRKEKIDNWLNTGDTGMGVDTTVRGVIRDYILQEQNHRCAICGVEDVWNGQPLKFILDHINGDASNSSHENIRLICPNCDSQLDTYKSKNKNSARNKRKEFLHKNYS